MTQTAPPIKLGPPTCEHMRLPRLALCCLIISAAAAAAPVTAEHAKHGVAAPNVVLLFADDLGYGGLSCYGNTDYGTPHLDRLALQGLKLTNFYVTTPGCAPSRAALLTGRYPFRSGVIRNPDPDHGLNQIGIPRGEILLSEALKSVGYATSCIGKWHLGHLPKYYPRQHGFDEYFGIPYSNSSRPAMLVENEKVVEYPVIQGNLTRDYTDRAVRFIEAHRERPFFLYVPYAMPHYPLAASEDFYTPGTPDDLYGDVIRELDYSVGRIVEKLDDLDLARRTIVIFTSDNGPWFGGSTGQLRGMKGSTFEGGIRVPMIARWQGRFPMGKVRHQPCGTIDLFPTLLAAAGAALPTDRVIDGVDLLPMLQSDSALAPRPLFSVVGNRVAAVRSGKWKLHVLRPGIPQWNDERFRPHKPDGVTIIAPSEQYPGTRFPGPLAGDPAKEMMLFDLANDPAERKDVAASHPEVVQRLLADQQALEAQIPADLEVPRPARFRRVSGPGRVTAQRPIPLQEVSFQAAGEQLKTRAKVLAGKPIRVVCFGDSVTGVYYHTGSRRAYTDVLGIALRQVAGSDVEMINAGISGHTTSQALGRIEDDVLRFKPDLVTVMFGLNDMVRVPLDQYRSNLQQIVTRCRAIGADVVLATPNNVITTARRPAARLVEYCQVVREVGREHNVPVCDCYSQLEAMRAADGWIWRRLMSDEIHPNMDGHKRIAEQLAQTITGQRHSLSHVAPPRPALEHTLARLDKREPLRVLAMPPFDAVIDTAIKQLEPSARVEVTTWPTANLSLVELENDAKARVRSSKPDLVLIAIPRSAAAETDEAFANSYAWVMNWSLNFGQPTWDVVVAHPEVTDPGGLPNERDDLIRRLVSAQDLSLIDRPPARAASSAASILNEWFREQAER